MSTFYIIQEASLYLEFAELLSMPVLKTAMTLQQFKTSTKLDININLTSKK